jgi:hypothetical protein
MLCEAVGPVSLWIRGKAQCAESVNVRAETFRRGKVLAAQRVTLTGKIFSSGREMPAID